MVSRMQEGEFSNRVFQYGVVPLEKFPEKGIEELYQVNKIWNSLVEIHNQNRERYE
jgi:hypothetical protein